MVQSFQHSLQFNVIDFCVTGSYSVGRLRANRKLSLPGGGSPRIVPSMYSSFHDFFSSIAPHLDAMGVMNQPVQDAALFPTTQFGLELGSILLIFTCQVWNTAFSVYASLKNIPREMVEAARLYCLSWWQRLIQLELPNTAIGLIWNSMMAVAGG